MFKSLLVRRYRSTVRHILAKLIAGKLIHADETNTNLQKGKGYVWVLASIRSRVEGDKRIVPENYRER
jgi:hypothetical protein